MRILSICSLLLFHSCMPNNALGTTSTAQINVERLQSVRVGMSQGEVFQIMKYPDKEEEIVTDDGCYIIWYYLTTGTALDQGVLLHKNLTPLVFKDGVYIGQGYNQYKKVLQKTKPAEVQQPQQPATESDSDLEKTLQSLPKQAPPQGTTPQKTTPQKQAPPTKQGTQPPAKPQAPSKSAPSSTPATSPSTQPPTPPVSTPSQTSSGNLIGQSQQGQNNQQPPPKQGAQKPVVTPAPSQENPLTPAQTNGGQTPSKQGTKGSGKQKATPQGQNPMGGPLQTTPQFEPLTEPPTPPPTSANISQQQSSPPQGQNNQQQGPMSAAAPAKKPAQTPQQTPQKPPNKDQAPQKQEQPKLDEEDQRRIDEEQEEDFNYW